MTAQDDRKLIGENLNRIKETIETAAIKSGRNSGDIILVGVTKTIDPERMEMLYDEGICIFGENKVQELTNKYDRFRDRVKWHLIGHLQTNKVKYVVGKTDLIHSADSIELLDEIDKRAGKLGIIQNVLLQVNVSGEETKHGFRPDDMQDVIKAVKCHENIMIKGLMTMAPNFENTEQTRPVFRGLKVLSSQLASEKLNNMKIEILSMGMTNDYAVAIEEGSNMIRLGTAIFGKKYIDIQA